MLSTTLCSSSNIVTASETNLQATNATNVTDKDQTTKPLKSIEKSDEYKWPKGPSNLVSESAILMDASSGLVLFEKKANTKRYPASITKILTTLIALENCSLNEIVTFSHNAVFSIESGSTHIARKEGEQLTMEQCLYAVMLASANEVSNAVAEHVAGSIDAFADLMNKKAKELGCKNTHFTNANGLHNDNHYTTAYDMALISKAALENKTFRKITATRSYTIPITNKSNQAFPMANHQQLLLGYKLTKKYDACIGGKTGYTNTARNTLVSFASKNGIDLIAVVMKSNATDQYKDTIKLFDFGFNNYEAHSNTEKITKTSDSFIFSRFNTLFNTDHPLLLVQNNYDYILPTGGKTSDVTQTVEFYDTKKIVNGVATIGKVCYQFHNKIVGSQPILYDDSQIVPLEKVTTLTADNTISKDSSVIITTEQTSSYSKKAIIVICLIVFLILYLLYYFFIEKKRKKKRKAYIEKRSFHRYTDNF